jgi:transposase
MGQQRVGWVSIVVLRVSWKCTCLGAHDITSEISSKQYSVQSVISRLRGGKGLAHEHVRASQEQLQEALDGRMDSAQRLLLRYSLDQIEQLRKQGEELDQEIARLLGQHQDAIGRLCAVPGITAVQGETGR